MDFINKGISSIGNPKIKYAGVQYERNPGAEFGEHIRNTTAKCNTSIIHTYGNVMSLVEKYLVDEIFPRGMFEDGTVLVSTTLASRQMRHLPNQLLKKEFPIMVLMPRISFGQGDNRFLSNTIMNSRYTNTQSFWGEGSLLPLAEDPKNNIWIHGHYNRAVMYIDVIVSFNTYAEQMNNVHNLWNMAPIMHNEFLTAPLELYIPESFCLLISKLTGIPIENRDSVYDFSTYMNSIFHNPITYKLNGGSNTNDFFMYYIADIDLEFQEPTYGSGVKDGQITRAYDISFTIRCDFNTIGYYTLNSPQIQQQINIPMSKEDTNRAIVPIFSDSINLNDFDLPIGWKVYSWPIFKLSPGENKISIDNVLNDSLRSCINYHLQMGIPMDKFIKIEFRENGQILNDEVYYIDWVNKELVLLNPKYRKTYRLIITVSIEYINTLIKELYDLE